MNNNIDSSNQKINNSDTEQIIKNNIEQHNAEKKQKQSLQFLTTLTTKLVKFVSQEDKDRILSIGQELSNNGMRYIHAEATSKYPNTNKRQSIQKSSSQSR